MKYGGACTGAICPDDVTLINRAQPDAKSSSATRTAKEAPTAQPMTPRVRRPLRRRTSPCGSRPSPHAVAPAFDFELAYDVPVRIEQAHLWDRNGGCALLPAGLSEEVFRREGRGRPVVLVREDRRQVIVMKSQIRFRRPSVTVAASSPPAQEMPRHTPSARLYDDRSARAAAPPCRAADRRWRR